MPREGECLTNRSDNDSKNAKDTGEYEILFGLSAELLLKGMVQSLDLCWGLGALTEIWRVRICDSRLEGYSTLGGLDVRETC